MTTALQYVNGQYAVKITPGIDPIRGGNNIHHGYFWPAGEVVGHFLWEYWTKPTAGAEYVISDGQGGNHAILSGWNGGGVTVGVSGNMRDPDGAVNISFTSIDQVPVNTLHHTAVGWDGSNIAVYLDGVKTGTVAYAGQRQAQDGILYIGGSDHSNFAGYIFRVRGFEGTLPFIAGLPAGYYLPEWFFKNAFQYNGVLKPAQFIADYSSPALVIPDTSAGYNGSTHPGCLSVGSNYAIYNEGNYRSFALPTFEQQKFEQSAYAGTAPSSTPAGAILFDEFRRNDITPVWYDQPTGNTCPTGQSWGVGCGIIAEKLFPWENSSVSAWIDASTPDVDITFTTGNTAKQMSYNFRRAGSDYLSIGVGINSGMYDVYLNKFGTGAGNVATATRVLANDTFTTVRILAKGTSVKVYFDGVLKMDATTSYVTGTQVGVTMDALCRLSKVEAYAS